MMVPFGPAMALMVAFAVKHFCSDFLFQTTAVARGKGAAHDWLVPLLIHALGHALVTLAIILVFYPAAWSVAVAEFGVHAMIDRGKALVARRQALDPGMARFWWLFGFDQLLHNLTSIAIVGVLLVVAASP